jgi:hypothetical protein
MMAVKPYVELSDKARTLLDTIINGYFEKIGWPEQMSHEEAHKAMVELLEKGAAKVIMHGDVGDPGLGFSIRVDPAVVATIQ